MKNNKTTKIKVDQIRSEFTQCSHSRGLKEKDKGRFTTAIMGLNHKIWQLPPINLTPKFYFEPQKDRLLQHSKKDSKYSNDDKNTWKVVDFPEMPRHSSLETQTQQVKGSKKEMITRFRIDSANTDRRKTLQTGFHDKEKYSQPRPHHFNDDIHRPLETAEELEKEDFVVKIERDAANIKFKNDTIKLTIPELTCKTTDTTRATMLLMDTKKIKAPKFDANLILPKSKYQKGRSSQDFLYAMIADKTGLFPVKEKYQLDRPNIRDNKTVDFLEITRTGPRHKCCNYC